MTTKELKAKYGDEKVLVIPDNKVRYYGDGPFYPDDDIEFCAKEDGLAKYRWEVENDPSFKQLVVYAVLVDNDHNIFTTHRLAGDSRLTGKYSVGTGGHVAPEESFTEALFRELNEEVGLSPDNITSLNKAGFIYDSSSDVNSVHLGVIYIVNVTDPKFVEIKETEKLAGQWLNRGQLAMLLHSKQLESWSAIVCDYCV